MRQLKLERKVLTELRKLTSMTFQFYHDWISPILCEFEEAYEVISAMHHTQCPLIRTTISLDLQQRQKFSHLHCTE